MHDRIYMESTNESAFESNWITEMNGMEYHSVYSQFGEETFIDHILNNIGIKYNYYVDYGAGGYGTGYSNTKFLFQRGWTGVMIDANAENENIIQEFITPDNACSILDKLMVPTDFDFFNIDLDSFDYDILQNVLKKYRPRLICAEFNSGLPVGSCIKLAYEEGYTWDGTNKYGYSFGAAQHLAKTNDYSIIYNHINTNLFMVPSELVSGVDFPPVTAEQKMDHPINNLCKWVPAL